MVGRLLIFTPTHGGLLQDRMIESVETQDFDGEVDWIINEDNPYPGRDMRNVCIQYRAGRQLALDGEYDAMLCVEHDMILPEGCVQALWDTDAPVCYAIYMLRHGTTVVSLFQKQKRISGLGMSLSFYPDELKQARKQGWWEVSGAGFGCTLMRRGALERAPFRMSDNAPDLPFASDCLRAGLQQIGRLDVPCGHIDPKKEIVLDPFAEYGGVVARVLALHTMAVNVNGESKPIKKDRYYTVPVDVATELERAGYVRITNGASEDDAEPVREVAVAPDALSRETATVKKIRPKRRRRKRREPSGREQGEQNDKAQD